MTSVRGGYYQTNFMWSIVGWWTGTVTSESEIWQRACEEDGARASGRVVVQSYQWPAVTVLVYRGLRVQFLEQS